MARSTREAILVAAAEVMRRKGYGAGLMNAAAAWSRDHGHPAIGLNVFAHNQGARALYDRLGYRVTLDYRALDRGSAQFQNRFFAAHDEGADQLAGKLLVISGDFLQPGLQ